MTSFNVLLVVVVFDIKTFLKVLGLRACSVSSEVRDLLVVGGMIMRKIFAFIEVEKRSTITFRQQPLFRQACELAYAECGSALEDYIVEQDEDEVAHRLCKTRIYLC